MDRLLFGISGLPIGEENKKYNYSTGIRYLYSIGLDAMELPFVRSVNVSYRNKAEIIKTQEECGNFYLSAHGSYYINLNAEEDIKLKESMERIVRGAEGIRLAHGNRLIFHPGFYLKSSAEDCFKKIADNLKKLPNLAVEYRLETTGKATQFGNLKEIVSLCKEIDTCKPCIDFSHIHARENGSLKNYEDFAAILAYIKNNLGNAALEDMHIHVSGINYTIKGERNHLPFKESDFNYIDFLKALKNFKVKGTVICESPVLEKDALLLKSTYYNL
ncbi:TIM barrel protein [Clostridium sp. 19966]|uniref:TIM barrel protein n=1 Tax=Clostridium sp. 19966 TaxID=2768166 RepID=UPI0028DE15E3|nr:TIM barrel protein [Clostridium sp. 19966]MDT8716378.1 TIM barrel protein [Clostridium sp. 19966]